MRLPLVSYDFCCRTRCAALRQILESCKIRCVTASVIAPLVSLVPSLRSWMIDGCGEGVVLTLRNHRAKYRLVKWKTATESQGGTPDIFGRALKCLQKICQMGSGASDKACCIEDGGGDKVCGDAGSLPKNYRSSSVQLIHPQIVDLIQTMYLVSISDCNGHSAKAVATRK